jgi:hypothetical protein
MNPVINDDIRSKPARNCRPTVHLENIVLCLLGRGHGSHHGSAPGVYVTRWLRGKAEGPGIASRFKALLLARSTENALLAKSAAGMYRMAHPPL